MSEIRVENIIGETGVDAVNFTKGVNVTGVTTATSFSGSGASLTSLPAANLTGTLPAISGANLTGISAGITDADQWRVTTNFTVSGGGVIGSNWERNDNQFDKIGNGMTESSGIFTFPSTGIWRIVLCFNANASSLQYVGANIQSTQNNSSFSTIAENYDSAGGTNYFVCVVVDTIYDCTNTSTHKVRFQHSTPGSTTYEGHSTYQRSGVTFIRLGDT